VQGNEAGVSIYSSSLRDNVHHCCAYLQSLAVALPSVLEQHDSGELACSPVVRHRDSKEMHNRKVGAIPYG